nr:hypothetical protein B0A51_04972 [Rachicladosporium sp. CCFEE 5018]
MVTAGWDPDEAVVKFLVRNVDLNLHLTDDAGPQSPDATVDWRELRRRGMTFLGRFDGATEDEIRDFAYALRRSKGRTLDKLQLPLRSGSQSNQNPETWGGWGRDGWGRDNYDSHAVTTARLADEAKGAYNRQEALLAAEHPSEGAQPASHVYSV